MEHCQINLQTNLQRSNQLSADDLPLSMAYVPIQKWRNLYSPEKGLQQGTIFKELDFPFKGKRGCKR